MDSTQQEIICSILGVQGMIDHGHYLGIPSLLGQSKRKAFDYLKDCVWKRINNWNTKKLSKDRKEILIKIIAQALPNYVMYVLLLPLVGWKV